ncbi:branched-chain amino acid ABC transporter permease [Diaphorobacter sp. HDW4B]|uniref:branched-chain amino acid ABC transporter permease n=1 Tax=Diaphorobacter sp. HDW4B TaxID=2714925 RepID=UPI0014083B7E|nr:branched-chain amino acid ABC transporter permease [Diaphorobacter sp. HDW4B]QIL69231.1 branched-chain amino acid ABC transporter permease [Diaphorobacter sp. HDW4B]
MMGANSSRHAVLWAFGLFTLVLIVAPLIFTSSLAISVLSQIGCAIIICLSFNILFGQGGMLSFGHAVYSGLGAFAAVHAIQLASRGGLAIPLVLIPLVGGLASMLMAALLGFVSTRKAGTTFAMITLGIGELVAAIALMFPGVFGGEGGISINRVYGMPFFGLTFGPALQVYGLIAVYCLVCTVAMFLFTRTPLGRMLNAVRDNPVRAEFIGYDPQRVRHLAFIVSGFFAGVGGALMAIHLEIVTGADSLGMVRSGAYLLFVFIGGAAFFLGPVLGAVLMVCSTVLLSHFTKAWLLYLGLAFVLMVIFAPGGLMGICVSVVHAFRSGRVRRNMGHCLLLCMAAVPEFLGAAALIEMTYHLQLEGDFEPTLHFLNFTLNVHNAVHWTVAAVVMLVCAATVKYALTELERSK